MKAMILRVIVFGATYISRANDTNMLFVTDDGFLAVNRAESRNNNATNFTVTSTNWF
jgi:hypothetical protein